MVLTFPAFFLPIQSSDLVRMNFTLLVTRFLHVFPRALFSFIRSLQVSFELDFPSKFSDFPFLFLALFGQDVALLTPLEVVAFQILKTFPLLTPLEVVVLFGQGITVLTPLEVVDCSDKMLPYSPPRGSNFSGFQRIFPLSVHPFNNDWPAYRWNTSEYNNSPNIY